MPIGEIIHDLGDMDFRSLPSSKLSHDNIEVIGRNFPTARMHTLAAAGATINKISKLTATNRGNAHLQTGCRMSKILSPARLPL